MLLIIFKWEGKKRRRLMSWLERSLPGAMKKISLFMLSAVWVRPIHTREGNTLYSVYWFKCYSQPKTPSQKYPECLTKCLGNPKTQLSWHKIIHHSMLSVTQEKGRMSGVCVLLNERIHAYTHIHTYTVRRENGRGMDFLKCILFWNHVNVLHSNQT